MPPGVFKDENNVRRSYERVLLDVELYRAIGKAAEHLDFGEASLEVRPYQVEAWSAIADARANGKDSALVQLATGLGKTTVGVVDALDFAVDFYQREGRPPKIMFAVHQDQILDQAATRFKEFAPSLTHGYYAGRNKNTNAPLTFATMQSLSQNLHKIDPNEFDYILYDEAHHAQAETYRDVIEHFHPEFKLALTATPDRMDDEDIRDLFGEEVYSKPLPEAMVEGYLADVDYHIVFDDAVKRAMEAGFTPETLGEMRGLLNNESRNEEIALQIWEEMERIGLAGAKTIVFCQDIQQADEMAELLGGKAYHSGITKEQRNETLKGFRQNGIQIITTRDMFNEGVDIPDAQLLVFLRSTSSKTVFEQQLGRGLRKHPGKDTVSVLDFVANVERLARVKELVDSIAKQQSKDIVNSGVETNNRKSGLTISTDHAEFDFDKISITLLEKFYAIRERANRYVPRTIEEAATLWRENFGNEEPTKAKIEQASKEGLFISTTIIRNLGGTLALKQALGFEARAAVNSIEEAVALWKQNFGDEEPTHTKIREASKSGNYVSAAAINKLGGVNVLKQALGFELERQFTTTAKAETIEDAAALWRENLGNEEPTIENIIQGFQDGYFISITKLNKLGGLKALKEELGLEPFLKISTLEEAAALWRENFGDEEPTVLKIDEASKAGRFVSASTINKLGGISGLKTILGFEVRPSVDSIEKLASFWRENFGDEEPTLPKIRDASKLGLFVSPTIVDKFGGVNNLKLSLGFELRPVAKSLQDAAALWRENFGDEEPTADRIIEASKLGLYVSTGIIKKFGGVTVLRAYLGFEVPVQITSIEEAAALWRKNFGDENPTAVKITEASKQGLFTSYGTISKFGGMSELKRALRS